MNEVGELVITQPMPSMPTTWNDEDGERYRSSDFEMSLACGATATGSVTDRGTAVIYDARSTINRGGVRMGTSELQRVEGVPEVLDSLVVDVEDQ